MCEFGGGAPHQFLCCGVFALVELTLEKIRIAQQLGDELEVAGSAVPVIEFFAERQDQRPDQVWQFAAPRDGLVQEFPSAHLDAWRGLVENGLDETALVPEVVMQGRGVALTGRAIDFVERDAVDAPLCDEPFCGRNDARARSFCAFLACDGEAPFTR